jgi:hypothetical protein
VFVALDENFDPVDLSGWVPRANVRLNGAAPVLINLNPSLITPTPLPAVVSATVNSQVLNCAAHGLSSGINLYFSGGLPAPLREGERYVVLDKFLTPDTFSVVSFHSAMLGETVPLKITAIGAPTFSGVLTPGQVKIPEISDGATAGFAEANAKWDLLLEDPSGRALGYYVAGDFIIKKGMTV